MKILNIITPCSRPDNISALFQSIILQLKDNILIKWWIICDGKEYNFWSTSNRVDLHGYPHFEINVVYFNTWGKGIVGHDQRNYALKYLPFKAGEYIYFLDDDNILTNDFIKEIIPYITGTQDYFVVVDQILKNGQIRLVASDENVFPGRIDTAQYILPYGLIKDIEFPLQYDGDGVFIHELYQRHFTKFIFINKPLCYYNYLR